MNQCNTPCIYYHINYDKSKSPMVKLTCDVREGEEIKNIPIHIKANCNYYKTNEQIKTKHNLLFSTKYLLTEV